MRIHRTNHRNGMTVLEVTIALAVLAMGLVLTAEVLTACARQRLAVDQQLLAQFEASNVLEHVASLRYEEVTSDAVQSIQPSSQLLAALPEAKVSVAVNESDGSNPSDADLPHKHIAVEVSWPTSDGLLQKVRLTAWKYPAAEARQ
jgi:prepilin-type N-terminal cleavage/methylation domain-containing protein